MVMKVAVDSADASGSFEVSKEGSYSCSGYTLDVTTDDTVSSKLRNLTFKIYGTIPD